MSQSVATTVREVKPDMIIQGIEMIGQQTVGILLGTKSKATICQWLARAGLSGISINNRKYYSINLIKEYLTYEKVEIREALELLREIKVFSIKRKQGEN